MRRISRPIVFGAVVGVALGALVAGPGALAGTGAATAGSGAQWTTYYRDSARSGLAPDGPSSPGAVKKQWSSPTLDGDVYAQPLLVGGRVVIATANDTVYSLDATDGTIVWKRHLGTPVPASSLPCGNVDPVGITSTPVVDVDAGRIYAVGMVLPARHKLFALDLRTGHRLATTGVDAPQSDPTVQNQRSALTLADGRVYIPFGGRFGDCGDYHGDLVAVATTGAGLGNVSSYTLPTENEGGWWSPPGATRSSDGSLLLADGNSSSSETYDYGDSVVRLSADLKLLDSFAPGDWASLNSGDADLGSTSPVLLPDDRVFQVGKPGVGYLLDAQHLGGIAGALHSGRVCDSSAFGGVAHDGATMYVPCSSGVAQVTASADSFDVGWDSALSVPGPTIVTTGAVWTVETGTGRLVALDPASGEQLVAKRIGDVPSRFTSAAAGGGRVVVAAARKVLAFGS
jgi:outer membrane protein assembly factor BamB